MAILDIRKEKKEEITEIKFNDTLNRIIGGSHITLLTYKTGENRDIYLCRYDELDTFIAALKKAKELWG